MSDRLIRPTLIAQSRSSSWKAVTRRRIRRSLRAQVLYLNAARDDVLRRYRTQRALGRWRHARTDADRQHAYRQLLRAAAECGVRIAAETSEQ